ncbi:MAG: XdhC family protein [Chloroflexota bacterium]
MHDDQRAVVDALHRAQLNNEPVALATVVHTQGSMPRHAGSKLLVRRDGSTTGTIGGGAMEASVIKAALTVISDGQPQLITYTLNNLEDGDPGICGGSAQIFIEPYGTSPTLLVVGGGHCGAALAELGKWLKYRVVLADDRAEFCNPDYIPGLDEYIVCPPEHLTDHISIDKNTYVAAVTRGLPVDIELIPALLETEAAYIGLIGSKRRWALTAKALEDRYGLTQADLSRVHAPIGLEIEAETPREIAISIMAEIIMIQRGGTGLPMRSTDNDLSLQRNANKESSQTF